jgi:hypothetical protein
MNWARRSGDQGANPGLDWREMRTRRSGFVTAAQITETHMFTAAARPDARRPSRVDANAVQAVVAVAQFMVILARTMAVATYRLTLVLPVAPENGPWFLRSAL